ncbi:MAG: ATP synthase F1 subunit delta [Mycoplasma sp.]|nr:ATP synthase F1 subunit delta [Mycoplasma sp.]
MADNSMIIYSSYSVVLYEYAKSDNAIQTYFDQAKWLLGLLVDQKHFLHNFLANYSINKKERKQIIDLVGKNKLSKKFIYFLYAVIDFNRGKLLIKILQKFLDICGKSLHIINIKVYVPFELEENLHTKLKDALENFYKSKINIEYHIDNHLIGGIKIETDSGSIDNTYQSKLKNLKESILKPYRSENN